MLEDSVKQRLVRFAKYKCKSVRAFEMATNLTVGYINAIRVSIQPDKIQRIASYYPDLNIDWLMTGNGEMLVETSQFVSEPATAYGKKCEHCRELEGRIQSLDQTIEAQRQTIQAQQELIAELKKGKPIVESSASA
jgi:hypothetical protein